MKLTHSRVVYFIIPFLFLIIYFQIFFVNYAYLDEIFQLWHNNDDTNFRMFHTQGRWLTGIIFKNFFSSISTITEIKILRWFSFFGWMATAITSSFFLRKWMRLLNWSEQTWWLASIYIACSISVCIYIGFASCLEVFLAVFFGLLSVHFLFTALYTQTTEIRMSTLAIIGCFCCALLSLFIYQPSFGVFLIPFFLHYVKGGKARPNRIVIVGVIFYLVVYIVYFFLFKYSLRVYHLEASNRTEIHFSFLSKLSFFFAGPLPNGFSLNLLFSASSLFSQIFYPVVLTVWTIITFKRNSSNSFAANVVFMGVILFLLSMIYFPSMIAAENFPSYRTLFAFNLAVFIMVIDCLLYVFKKEKAKWIFTIMTSVVLLATGIYTFNFQFINPLKKEYSLLRAFFDRRYTPNIDSVYFIRADKYLFNREFHTDIYRDEFGAPSTYRDWVPEPIVRQMIFEITKSRKVAEQTSVAQFENKRAFDSSNLRVNPNNLLIDVNSLFGK